MVVLTLYTQKNAAPALDICLCRLGCAHNKRTKSDRQRPKNVLIWISVW